RQRVHLRLEDREVGDERRIARRVARESGDERAVRRLDDVAEELQRRRVRIVDPFFHAAGMVDQHADRDREVRGEVEGGDRLRLLVFEDGEVLPLEIRDRRPGRVGDGDRQLDQVHFDLFDVAVAAEEQQVRGLVAGGVGERRAHVLDAREARDRDVDRVRRVRPLMQLLVAAEEDHAPEVRTLRVLDAQLEMRDAVGRDDTRDLHLERRLALVDDERIGVEVASLCVVAYGPDFDALRQFAEVELRVVRRRVAGEDLFAVDEELDALHHRIGLDADDEEVRRDVAPRRDDAHRADVLRDHAFRENPLAAVTVAGDVRLVRLRERELLRSFIDDDRSGLLDRHDEAYLDLALAFRKGLNRTDRLALRGRDGDAEVANDESVL